MKKMFIVIFLILLTPHSVLALKETSVYLPAVKETDNGYESAVAILNVNVKEGNGHVFVDTSPLTKIDTQASARIARDVACRLVEVDCSNLDLFYVIRSDAQIVGGPSAGASMTVATLASLLDLNASKSVVLTGTINPDGTIGSVGGILEKAEAAAYVNGTQFLVPTGQSVVYYDETKTEQNGPITYTQTTPKRIDVRAYAKKEWGIEVIEVGNVEQALRYYTGYQFKEKKGVTIDTSKYIEVMKNVSLELKADALKDYNEAKNLFDGADITKGTDVYVELEGVMNHLKEELTVLKDMYADGNYYGASSQAFKISIETSYVKNTVGLLEAEDDETYLDGLIGDVEKKVDKTEEALNESSADNMIDVELIAVSSQRINEAKDLVKEAWKNFYNDDFLTASYYAAYAEERSNTAETWFEMTKVFGGNETFDFGDLNYLAKSKVDEANSAVVYASTVTGGESLDSAAKVLKEATDDLDKGDYASAIINAATAKVQANVIMETRGLDDLSEKVDTAKVDAELAIKDTERTVYPIVAVSYYEYAKTFNDSYDSLLYYSYAKEFAGVSKNLHDVFEGESFESPVIVPSEVVEPVGDETKVLFIVFIVGLVTGAVVVKTLS